LGITPGIILIAALIADAFVAPQLHEVQTPDAVEVKALWIDSAEQVVWMPSPPTQSFTELSCRLPRSSAAIPCPPLIEGAAPALYFVQALCVGPSSGRFSYEGHNLEYFPSSRTLVIHCYIARGWLEFIGGPMGVAAVPRATLLVVPTAAMGPGSIKIVEDNRIEHLFGDQSDEFQVATATIS
jgi:hypothetical protein